MKYYDIDSTAVWLILDEMEELLEGDQLLIFRALREGINKDVIAHTLGITRHALKLRIQRIWRKIRTHFIDLDLPRMYNIEDLF